MADDRARKLADNGSTPLQLSHFSADTLDKWAIRFRSRKSRAGVGWRPPRFAFMKRGALLALRGQGEGIGAIPVQFSAVLHSLCSPRRSGCP